MASRNPLKFLKQRQLVVEIEGGLVQNVFLVGPKGTRLAESAIVIDDDVEGADGDEITRAETADGNTVEAVVRSEVIDHGVGNDIAALLKAYRPSTSPKQRQFVIEIEGGLVQNVFLVGLKGARFAESAIIIDNDVDGAGEEEITRAETADGNTVEAVVRSEVIDHGVGNGIAALLKAYLAQED